MEPRDVLDTQQAADYLQVSRQLLELLRVKGGGPRYAKLGRLVRYRRASLDEWLASKEQNHTAEGAQ
ncbi:helix-turn-helix transcriptional regulator [Pseudomonas aeruginosa]|uniref:helix-turn-helix transcriptional regulator n=1 Tax=Pseudomonas aeruginosa TaxID=287 RepID=UPI000FF5939F|nr:helix-turn-helix domain-containing protein [Pseudomonas aeruginosa]RWX91337.1 DNA-binding protein [Pseudomonas aeruginosa]